MDQRPTRLGPRAAARGQVDENFAPPLSKQNLHQRTKSSGNMAITAGIGGINGAPKRAAFADVSNTVKVPGAYDDTGITSKQVHEITKPLAQGDKTAAFLRPAQRPLKNVASKAALNTSVPSDPHPAPVISKVPLADSRVLPTGPKRTLTKKATAIYKDADAEDDQPAVVASQPTRQEPLPIAPTVYQTLGPRQQNSLPQLQQAPPGLDRIESKCMKPVSAESDYTPESDPACEDTAEEPVDDSAEAYHAYQQALISREFDDHYPASYHEERQPPPVPSPETSQWELDQNEVDDDEIYDEQGYTTAHSYRSGGNTTGVTTVLAPKVTINVKKEIAAARHMVESARTMEEIEDEAWDTSMVAEYGDEIFAYMRELENKMLPNANYMDTQTEIQWSMRSVLMDWLIQVHHRFSLLPETLFLCVNYIDRFLSSKIVSLGKLQLVGATAIFVAAKYEEINCPSVNEIVYMVDGGYTVDEILKAERFMLTMLQFELGWPGPMSFLRRISKADDYDLETRTLAKYFLEVTIMDERFVGCPPSYVAAGAHCFARLMLKKGDWSPPHVYYSGYTWTQLKPLVSMIFECCVDPLKHHAAVYEKYSDRRYKRASQFVQAEFAKGFRLPVYHSRPSLPHETKPIFPGKN
ncbi:hypothetical protein BUE80_DR010987 [Diplocarpon rosae]|nr:hypothetical protein BUE80_DR010987 [Diplocarpon rosae]